MEDLVKEFKEKYDKIGRVKKRNRKEDRKEELPDRYMAKKLYEWDNKRFDKEYWERLERNWNEWKRKGRGRKNRGME